MPNVDKSLSIINWNKETDGCLDLWDSPLLHRPVRTSARTVMRFRWAAREDGNLPLGFVRQEGTQSSMSIFLQLSFSAETTTGDPTCANHKVVLYSQHPGLRGASGISLPFQETPSPPELCRAQLQLIYTQRLLWSRPDSVCNPFSPTGSSEVLPGSSCLRWLGLWACNGMPPPHACGATRPPRGAAAEAAAWGGLREPGMLDAQQLLRRKEVVQENKCLI